MTPLEIVSIEIIKLKRSKQSLFLSRVKHYTAYRKFLGQEQQAGRNITKKLDDLEKCVEELKIKG